MKLRTAEDLSDALDEELSWRKKELRSLRIALISADAHQARFVARACVTLTYAHLEGFFKGAGTLFLKYLSNVISTTGELASCFQAICATQALRRQFSGQLPADTVHLADALLKYMERAEGEPARLSAASEIRTGSNLNSGVLRSVLRRTGLDEDMFSLKEK